MNPISMNTPMMGRFKLSAVNAATGLVMREVEAPFCNLLLNTFFDLLLGNETGPANTQYIRGFWAGAGNTPPLETDTTLQSPLGWGNQIVSADSEVQSTVAPRYIRRSVTVRGAMGDVVGNVSEIAMYSSSSTANGPVSPTTGGSRILSRALVRDSMGNPTSIQVLSDEILEVTWDLYQYVMDNVTGTWEANIRGVVETFDYELRPILMNNSINSSPWSTSSNGWRLGRPVLSVPNTYTDFTNANISIVSASDSFLPVSGDAGLTPGSNSYSFQTLARGPYTPGSAARDFTLNIGLTNGNIPNPGIRSFIFVMGDGGFGISMVPVMYQMILDRPFLKTNLEVFSLPMTVSYANATPPGV